MNREIGMEEWEEHFKGLLGGVEGRVLMGEERLGRTMEERDIEKEEIWNVMRKVKDKKAMGRDGIPNEVWKYGGEEVREWGWKLCNRVWRGEGRPEEWKEGVIVPVVKKGKGRV